jgi:long-chain acyl-CoA synthetase
VKVLHFTDIELPRTATRKVKRREVVEIMESLEESQKSASVVKLRKVPMLIPPG